MKTGNESIEAIMRERRILFAGFVARMEDMRLSRCAMFGELLVGAGCMRGRKKSGWGVSWMTSEFLISNADQWTTAAQAKGIAAENARVGLRHAEGCPNVVGWSKDRIAQNKRARAGSLAIIS